MEFIKMIDTNDEIIYFDTFKELCNYFDKVAIDFYDLIEQLEEEAAGMAIPKIDFCNKFEVEFVEDGTYYNAYYDTFEEANKEFNYRVECAKNKEEDYVSVCLYEYDFKNCGDFEERKALYYSEKSRNYEVLIDKRY